MAWIVGIDEAGYGPNLGPFVMTAVACRTPDRHVGANLWQVLRQAVRKHSDSGDDRVLIDDSKLVYGSPEGLAALETGIHATIGNGHRDLNAYVADFAGGSLKELKQEVWYLGTTPLPAAADPEHCRTRRDRFLNCCQQGGIAWGMVRSVVVCPGRFNQLVERWGSKGTVLGECLADLLAHVPTDDEPIHYFIDKHGGRNFYAAMLQQAIPDGMVVAREEGSQRSRYEVLGLPRRVTLTFEPRADGTHMCVALASMASKYLRELLMQEFNGFWQTKLPGLKPTAGYPGDATRFFRAIRATAQQLGIAEQSLWRCR